MEQIISLRLSDEAKSELIRFYRSKLESARIELRTYEDLLSQLTEDQIVTSVSEVAVPYVGEFNRNWSWALKAKYAIIKAGKCLTTREIIQELGRHEVFNKTPINSLSGTLSEKITKGILFGRYQPNDGGDFYYGLKEWFYDGISKVKEQYAVRPKQNEQNA